MRSSNIRAAVRRPSRRLVAGVGACLGTVLAILGTTNVAAVATENASTGPVAPPTAAVLTPALTADIDTVAISAPDAAAALAAAQASLESAEALQEEIAASDLELEGQPVIDTAPLRDAVERLQEATFVPVLLFPALAEDAAAHAQALDARVAEAAQALEAARAQKAAEEAAAEAQRQAEAAAAAEAQRQAELLAAVNTPAGARAYAQQLAAERYGWGGDQFSCLVSLWEKESNWNYQAYNPSSGATGIPQALPGSKMASAGPDWQTNAATQIAWGLDYIARAYGSPCSAWGHSQATNWY
ncbi:phospholipase [Microbacterium lushaniae]|uniref:Phospholipase n=1 Tax=Microbacterium lushaniae TaxID=2614639 RepID=A0A5J6L2Z9_9MICO|nr:phospholipase [Microbacterium lushaniae]QEW02904.1 phospholipase [Microbacterium lushaniae]